MTVEILKEVYNPLSKQASENQTAVGTRTPKIDFKTFTDLYYNSFIVSGLTDKISTAIQSGFNTQDDELKQVLNGIDHSFLNRNKVLTGNAFFEVIRDGTGRVVELLPMISGTVEMMEDGDGYIQTIGSDKVYFNAFTPLDKQSEKQNIWEKSQAREDELVNTGEGCGFNPNLNELYHFKNTSLETKYYGNSYFEAVINQLVLIQNIDKYYIKGFNNGMIKTKLLYAKGDKGFNKNDKEVLKEFVKNKMKGIDKSFSTAIIDKEIGQLELEHDIDAKAFIEYRTQLMQSVAIALNVPYDLLLSESSNRASSQVSMETFNQYTIKPLQYQNIEDFKILFQDNYDVESLEYINVDTKDQKEEMEVMTGYKKAGILTPNEIREKLSLEPIQGGDELVNNQMDSMLKKESKNFYDKLTDIENDIGQNL